MNIFIETLGCTFNQADSQIMAGILKEKGINIVDSISGSDICILNTCYVKHPTEHKVINKIKNFNKNYPDKKLIVAGCMVEIEPEKLESIAPNANWVGPHKIHNIYDIIQLICEDEIVRETGIMNKSKSCLPKLRSNPYIHILQICEGCLGKCNYCCTKFARGNLYSYKSTDLLNEAKSALDDGCLEIQITAQDTAVFGKDTGEKLSDLINNISDIDKDFRIRVGMMHPKNVLDDLDGLIGAFKSEKVYNFLHLPVQTGSDKVLREMNRMYTCDDFKLIVSEFKKEIPDLSVATDIIVAYPTENEDDFNDTVRLIKEIKPNFIHLSKYKHRFGVESSKLSELDFNIVKKRSKIIESLKHELTSKDNSKLIDSSQKVLIVEKGKKGGFVGRTNSYMPVIVNQADLGSFMDIKISEATSTYFKSYE